MNSRTKLIAAATLLLLAAPALTASALPFAFGKKKPTPFSDFHKPTPEQNALIDKAIGREAVVIKTLKERAPLVETYIQNMKPDPIMGQVPDSDWHSLARVSFGKAINDEGYATQKNEDTGGKKHFGGDFFKHSLGYLTGLSASLHLQWHEGGFVRMIVIDTQGPNDDGFNRQNYRFSFVRNDFLGTVPTEVFDVRPVKASPGRFMGRIWIERNGGNIVRYNGDLAGSDSEQVREYFHFDSWRTNVQPGLWLPTSVYIEETNPKSPEHVLKFKAISHIWGYSLKVPQTDAEMTNVQVVGANDESQQAPDVSPLEAQREWVEQAEDNVIARLFQAGLIDAPSPFDDTLAQLANNILIYNNIQTDRPLKVRTLMTSNLESLAVGDTILLSKGLIDTTAVPTQDGQQQLGNLNCLLAFQIAHIILGHHIDTKYAFNDRLLFPDESAFQRLPMEHTDADDEAAAKKAMQLLSVKDLESSQQYFSLYLQQLQAREKGLKGLDTPLIGDSLVRPDGTFWMQALLNKGPKLSNTDLKQQAAMPLGQFLKYDPWTDEMIQMHVAYEPLLGAPDKMPFEITPVYLRLTYYVPPAPPAGAPPAAADNGAAAGADNGAATGANNGGAQGTNAPPQNQQ